MPRKVVQPSSAHYTRLELCQLMGAHKRVKNCNILLNGTCAIGHCNYQGKRLPWLVENYACIFSIFCAHA